MRFTGFGKGKNVRQWGDDQVGLPGSAGKLRGRDAEVPSGDAGTGAINWIGWALEEVWAAEGG